MRPCTCCCSAGVRARDTRAFTPDFSLRCWCCAHTPQLHYPALSSSAPSAAAMRVPFWRRSRSLRGSWPAPSRRRILARRSTTWSPGTTPGRLRNPVCVAVAATAHPLRSAAPYRFVSCMLDILGTTVERVARARHPSTRRGNPPSFRRTPATARGLAAIAAAPLDRACSGCAPPPAPRPRPALAVAPRCSGSRFPRWRPLRVFAVAAARRRRPIYFWLWIAVEPRPVLWINPTMRARRAAERGDAFLRSAPRAPRSDAAATRLTALARRRRVATSRARAGCSPRVNTHLCRRCVWKLPGPSRACDPQRGRRVSPRADGSRWRRVLSWGSRSACRGSRRCVRAEFFCSRAPAHGDPRAPERCSCTRGRGARFGGSRGAAATRLNLSDEYRRAVRAHANCCPRPRSTAALWGVRDRGALRRLFAATSCAPWPPRAHACCSWRRVPALDATPCDRAASRAQHLTKARRRPDGAGAPPRSTDPPRPSASFRRARLPYHATRAPPRRALRRAEHHDLWEAGPRSRAAPRVRRALRTNPRGRDRAGARPIARWRSVDARTAQARAREEGANSSPPPRFSRSPGSTRSSRRPLAARAGRS